MIEDVVVVEVYPQEVTIISQITIVTVTNPLLVTFEVAKMVIKMVVDTWITVGMLRNTILFFIYLLFISSINSNLIYSMFDPYKLDFLISYKQFTVWARTPDGKRRGGTSDEEVSQRYKEYRESFQHRQLQKFFDEYKDKEWWVVLLLLPSLSSKLN